MRHAFGESNFLAKLKEKDIFEIRELYHSNKIGKTDLAKKFGITRKHLWNIGTRLCWNHI